MGINTHPAICNLCGGKVKLKPNSTIYGKSYGSGYCYFCTKCKAYVGTHKPRPLEAMGILADKEMRELKTYCHELFDRLWTTQNERRGCYHKLANRMGIPLGECHFGYFNKEQLYEALTILKGGLK